MEHGFIGKPCTSQDAYKYSPKKKTRLDLEKLGNLLHDSGFFISIKTPFLLSIKVMGKPVSIFKSGKIIVKETREKKSAEKVIKRLLKEINFN